MRKVLKWKPYQPHAVTVMSIEQREKRMSDKKYFVLKQCPNRKSNVCWSPSNPHVLVECKSQSNLKVMCWTGLYNGKVLGPFWIEGTMDILVYNSLLKDQVWTLVKGVATRQQLDFMQDGATCHTVVENLAFLSEKFGGCVISNKKDIPWSANSPDLNLFLGACYDPCLQD